MITQLPPEPDKHQLTAKAPIHHLAVHKELSLGNGYLMKTEIGMRAMNRLQQ